MAISATLSVFGLYQYDSTIFDEFSVPTAVSKSDLTDNILLESASLEVLYPDPNFLKKAIGTWSTRRVPIWTKLAETTGYIYNPIYNYDRHEEETVTTTDTEDGSNSRLISKTLRNSGTETRVLDGEVKNTGTDTSVLDSEVKNTGTDTSVLDSEVKNTGTDTSVIDRDTTTSNNTSGTSTSTDSKTAFNANTFTDTFKTAKTGSDQNSGTGTEDVTDTRTLNTKTETDTTDTRTLNTKTETDTTDTHTLNTKTETDNTDTLTLNTQISDSTTDTMSVENEKSGTVEREHHAYGNIGVTTTQQMIEQERQVVQFDLMQIITTEFIEKFCIGVY